MNIFLDTADIRTIKQFTPTGLIDGVTTNPSLMLQAGGNPRATIEEILTLLPKGQISVEITELHHDAAYKQAKNIAAISPNILVKVPCHKDYYPLIHKLSSEGIPLNITLVFTLIQGLMMAKLGVKYISPFVGRWDDIDVDGMQLIHDLRGMIDQYGFETGILSASLRHLRHVHESIAAGADAITIPGAVFEKMISHPLTDQGIEKFTADWKKLEVTTFP